jgi:DNA-binding response OmpR family regulator
MKNQRVTYNREQLLNNVWGYDYYGEDRVVDSSIKRLRKKLVDCNYIKTVFGIGYKFEVTTDET